MLLELIFLVQLQKMQFLQILGKFRKAVGDALTKTLSNEGFKLWIISVGTEIFITLKFRERFD